MPRQSITYWKSAGGLSRLAGWARDGSGEAEIAGLCGVSQATLRRWRQSCRDIDNALTQAERSDEDVENALFRLATGFTVREERTKDGKNGEESTVVVKEIPPNFSAASFWLRNRRPERWGNSPDDAEARSLDMLDDILDGLEQGEDK